MKDKIVVLHSKDVKKAQLRGTDKPFAWLYLGYEIKQREHISQVLGKGTRYLIGDLLQRVAHREKQSFVNFIAELGLRQKNRRHWWASNTAYKNPVASNLFLLWCYAAVFDAVCSQKIWGEQKQLYVFIEDRWLYRYLWQRYKETEDSFSYLSRKSIIPELLKSVVHGIFARSLFLLRARRQLWQKRDTVISKSGDEIYLYSWTRASFFQNGEFKDAYWGRLPQILSSNGQDVVYLTPLFLPATLKSKCSDYGKFKFIFLDQYINLWNLIRSVLAIFIISPSVNSPLKILLLREMAYGFRSFPINMLEYYAFKGCLKEIRQERTTIIYTFENQPWDKMLCLAAKELDKNISLVGYQHSMVPWLLLNYFPGAGEAGNMPLPHLIVTNGEYTLNLLKNAGYGETEFVNGGALRYEYLHVINKGYIRREESGKTVLVAMSYSAALTGELLISLFNVFQDLAGKDIRFLIKFHPEVPLERLRVDLPPWPTHFQKTNKLLSEVMKEVDLVIYSSSSVGLETLLYGVPVVRYCSEHSLNLDPLDILDETAVEICSENNLESVVLSALEKGHNSLAQRAPLNDRNLNKYFSPVDEDVWRQIIRG